MTHAYKNNNIFNMFNIFNAPTDSLIEELLKMWHSSFKMF